MFFPYSWENIFNGTVCVLMMYCVFCNKIYSDEFLITKLKSEESYSRHYIVFFFSFFFFACFIHLVFIAYNRLICAIYITSFLTILIYAYIFAWLLNSRIAWLMNRNRRCEKITDLVTVSSKKVSHQLHQKLDCRLSFFFF